MKQKGSTAMNIAEEILKANLPEKERTKYKGSTALNIENEILAQLRKE